MGSWDQPLNTQPQGKGRALVVQSNLPVHLNRNDKHIQIQILFHGLHPLHVPVYLDRFTVPTVSKTKPVCTYTDLGSRGYFGI